MRRFWIVVALSALSGCGQRSQPAADDADLEGAVAFEAIETPGEKGKARYDQAVNRFQKFLDAALAGADRLEKCPDPDELQALVSELNDKLKDSVEGSSNVRVAKLARFGETLMQYFQVTLSNMRREEKKNPQGSLSDNKRVRTVCEGNARAVRESIKLARKQLAAGL